MSPDEALEIYTYQTAVVEYAEQQGVPKVKMVRLFDTLDKLNNGKFNKDIILEIEKHIASIAEDSFDEKLNSVLIEIKKGLLEMKK